MVEPTEVLSKRTFKKRKGEIQLKDSKTDKELKKNPEHTVHIARESNRMNFVPTDDLALCKLAEELVVWVGKDDAWNIDDFPLYKGYAPCRFYRTCEKHPVLQEALSLAKHTIASRLLSGWRTGDVSYDFCKRILPLYHPHYKQQLLEERQAIGNLVRDRTDSKVVVEVVAAANSDLVPEKGE